MTSNCDVTKSVHQIQMTTICHWMKPLMKIFSVRHCTPSLVNIYIACEICSKKIHVFLPRPCGFYKLHCYMKNTDKPNKQVRILPHICYASNYHTHSLHWLFKILGYSIIFLLLIAIRARSVTFTSCTPTMAVQRSQSYIRQSYQVIANCFQVIFQKHYFFHIIWF